MQAFAKQLRYERERCSWSQEQFAELVGTTATNVSRWERGVTFPKPYFRQKLCELLGKNAEELSLLEPPLTQRRRHQIKAAPSRVIPFPTLKARHSAGTCRTNATRYSQVVKHCWRACTARCIQAAPSL